MQRKKKSRAQMLASSAVAALAAAFMTMSPGQAVAAETLDEPAHPTINTTDTAVQTVVAPAGATQVVKENSHRWIAAATVSGLIGSLLAVFGANRILQFVANLGSWFGKGAKSAADASFKTAKAAAGAATKAGTHALRKSGRWLLIATSLTIFVFTGIAVLDLEWPAGLLTGAGITGAAAYGFNRTRDAVRDLMKKARFGLTEVNTSRG